ncbi:zinc-finger binding domain of transposase IS66 [Acididesulfobacillus acetoxydans]|uniref:Transposase n=1 Tax=Acididesulfobacillus acetoxydans TaxID=1561005 RepID=A0A8S0XW37_9FIRM|nr:zinc-finger binding domain of transposase IS66 [Acididesulfobacillus acetoxydans]CEJ08635.1 Transposase [Acididesulfobacillus acetoxydans]
MTTEDIRARCLKLEKQNERLQRENAQLNAMLDWFKEQLRLGKHRQFGTSNERTILGVEQLNLFNEAEKEAQPLQEEPAFETVTYQRRKQRNHREVVLADLPVERIEYKLPAEEQVCSCCGGPLHVMSTEVRQELQFIPAQMKVIEHVREVYSCRHCEREEIKTPIVTAPMPAPVLPGSFVSPSLMAHIMNQKYVEGMPLYRQEQQFGRLDLELSRQTMANWMLYGAKKWLTPLYDRMHWHLLKQDILQADETTLQVLHEPGRAAETDSYMWFYRTGRMGPPIVLYDYQETRSGQHPRQFLSGFKGYLQVDGYGGYNGLPNVTLVGCWSHSRRKFNEALKALPPANRSALVAAKEGLEFCNRLFAIERDLKDATPEERFKNRLARSRPVLDAFLDWLYKQQAQVLPKSTFGRAIQYCLNQWDKLVAFLQEGRLEIDNNRSLSSSLGNPHHSSGMRWRNIA